MKDILLIAEQQRVDGREPGFKTIQDCCAHAGLDCHPCVALAPSRQRAEESRRTAKEPKHTLKIPQAKKNMRQQ